MRKIACTALMGLLVAACGQAPAPPRIGERQARPDAPLERAQYHLMRRLPAGQDALPMDAYVAPRVQAAQMRAFDTRSNRAYASLAKAKAAPGWEWLGPSNIAGRVRTLVFDPRDPQRMYVGGVSGGVWRSDDGGRNWSARSDSNANVNIGALAIDPVDPDVLYAGTGELYRRTERPYSSMTGEGIFRTSDAGETWTQLASTRNGDFLYVSDIVISPLDPQRIYAATNSGVWRSDDGGISFTQSLRPQDSAGKLLYEGCTDLLIEAEADRDRVLAACSSRSTDDRYWLPGMSPEACAPNPCPSAVYLNTDASRANTWITVIQEAGMGRVQMDASRDQPQTIYALAASILPGPDRTGDGIGDYDNGLHALFRSDDGGRSWRATLRNDSADLLSTWLLTHASGASAQVCDFGGNDYYSAGWYNMAIAVDPVNPETVWVGGMDIYRSDDGGRSFGLASWWWLQQSSPSLVHSDQHLLRFHPEFDGAANQILFSTNDGGVAVSQNARAAVMRGPRAACGPDSNLVAWQPINQGLGTTQFYTGDVFPDGNSYLGGTQDNGTLLGRSANTRFSHILGGDGAHVAIDPRDPDTIYASAQNISIHRSTNGGLTFVPASNGIQDQVNFIMPYLIDPNAPDRLFAGGRRLWRSDDQGRNWLSASQFLGSSFDARISALAIADGNSEHMVLGNRDGIHASTSALSSTLSTRWALAQPREGWVSSLIYDPHDADIVYATYSTFGGAHVWRSGDAGLSWAGIDGSGAGQLPDIPVHSLAVDPADTRRLYVGTDLGVFVSVDGGANWAVENTGFSNVITERLKVNVPTGGGPAQLYAFTYGRGVWRVPLSGLDGMADDDFQLGPEATGSWFSPGQDGHGLVVQIVEIEEIPHALVYWFAYRDGQPVWLIGNGPVDGDRVVADMLITEGTGFPPAFDPEAVQRIPWGQIEIEFSSADALQIEWSSELAGFSSGSLPMQRFTAPRLDDATDPDALLRACHSGSWYSPAQSGHGFITEVLEVEGVPTLLTMWFVYRNGEPFWLIGTGPIQGNAAELAMLSTAGTDFPPAFDPSAVQRIPWGTLRFEIDGDDNARTQWTALDSEAFPAGELELARLTRIAGRDCGDTPSR